MTDSTQQLTLVAQIEDVLKQPRTLAAGYQVRHTEVHNKEALAMLYFAVYPRNIVADMHAARDEMERTFAGEYGPFSMGVSPIIVRNHELVAAAMVVDAAPWSDTPSGPFMIEVMVHPQYRRLGLAEYALQWAAHALDERGEQTIALRVLRNNASAYALYQKLGFHLWTPESQS